MFCAACGQPVTQPYCEKCGAPSGLPAGGLVPVGTRLSRHLRTLGILWIAYAVYEVLRLLVLLPVLHMAFGSHGGWIEHQDMWVYTFHPGGWLVHLITVVVVVRAVFALVVGFGLLRAQPWARVAAIVLAILTLIKPLLGTILAIYTLWVLLSHDAGPEYDRIASLQPPL